MEKNTWRQILLNRKFLIISGLVLVLAAAVFIYSKTYIHKKEEMAKPAEEKKMEAKGQEKKEEEMVMLSPEAMRLVNVKTSPVEYRQLTKEIYTVGKIDINEKRRAYVASRIPGRIERLYVNYEGYEVSQGQPLLEIYSPDLISTQEEYLLALETREKIKESKLKEVRTGADNLVEAAKRRLMLWGITEEQIARLEKDKKPKLSMTIYSPISGVVLKKDALLGKYVMEGENLFTIGELSSVWMVGEAYEADLPWVKMGQMVEVTIPSFPGQTFHGTINFIEPTVHPEVRTIKFRCDLQNRQNLLKPEMFVNVKIFAGAGSALSIPTSSVLDTGTKKYIIMDHGEGMYMRQEVVLGPEAGGYYPVVSGLKQGDLVAVDANFLIDSQTQFQRGGSGMAGMEHGAPKTGEPGKKPAPAEERKGKEQGAPSKAKEPAKTDHGKMKM